MQVNRKGDGPGVTRCPRCEIVALIEPTKSGPGKALSRETRDEGAEVLVCDACGEREALRPKEWPRTPITVWPLSIDELLAEDRVWYTFARNGRMELMVITPDDAKQMLGEDAEDDGTSRDDDAEPGL